MRLLRRAGKHMGPDNGVATVKRHFHDGVLLKLCDVFLQQIEVAAQRAA
jgi:hypothetical protein